ncbi:MAG: ATP-binding protein [Balneolales bacterium]
MIKSRIKKIFTLGFRLALFAALLFLPVSFTLLFITTSFALSLWVSLGLSLFIFFTVYFYSAYLIKERLARLSTAFQNFAEKDFNQTNPMPHKKRDELDYLILQSAKTRRTVEKEIQRLTKIENYRKEFIGDISHELKTPTFAVQGFVETLIDGALYDEKVNMEFLKKTMRNVNRLIYLTNDLMEISKLETGELKPVMQSVNLNQIIREVMESLQYKAGNEEVSIEFNTPHNDLHVLVDRHQIRQVLINLTENGIKYNKPGGKVIISIKKSSNASNKVHVNVQDTGIGIDQDILYRVTERFFRVDKSRSREKGGTGLGLAIVKHIIESHNETLTINSKPGKGSVFSFTLQNADHVMH